MKRILILTACLLLMATSMVLAQGEPQTCPKAAQASGDMPMMMKCRGGAEGGCGILGCKELNLTKEQMAKAEAINFAHQKAMIDLKASLEKAQLNMHHEMNATSPDRAKVLAAAKEVNAIEAKMDEARINHRFDLRALLTPEQLAKYGDCCKAFGGGMGCMKDRDMGRGMMMGGGCKGQGMGGDCKEKCMKEKAMDDGCQRKI